jgi:hypothetical protein
VLGGVSCENVASLSTLETWGNGKAKYTLNFPYIRDGNLIGYQILCTTLLNCVILTGILPLNSATYSIHIRYLNEFLKSQ